MNIIDAIKVIRKMGLSWTVFRASYELKRRTGILKRKVPCEGFFR